MPTNSKWQIASCLRILRGHASELLFDGSDFCDSFELAWLAPLQISKCRATSSESAAVQELGAAPRGFGATRMDRRALPPRKDLL